MFFFKSDTSCTYTKKIMYEKLIKINYFKRIFVQNSDTTYMNKIL